jgi:tetratricopeptide (TPR) repeat protein
MNSRAPAPTTLFIAEGKAVTKGQRRKKQLAKVSMFSMVLLGAACAPTDGRGPASPAEIAYLADKPSELQRLFRAVITQGERNAVLNNMRAGLAAMDTGHYALAASAFDAALGPIEAIYADNPQAAQARSLFAQEASKPFRGEPYERMMAYYYRGVLYLRAGDWGNARASFRAAMLQDSLAEEEQFRADAGIMAWLEGWASHCEGNRPLANGAFDEATRLSGGLRRPSADDNLLLIGELGSAPAKVAAGSRRELLRILASSTNFEDGAEFTLGQPQGGSRGASGPSSVVWGGRSVRADRSESISWQAVTRGGRQFDSILAGKAQFQSSASASSSGLINAGGAIGGAPGLVIIGIGLAAAGAAAGTNAEADTRAWDNLPDRLVFTSMAVSTNSVTAGAPVRARFLRGGQIAPGILDVETRIGGDNRGRCGVAWARSRRATDVPNVAPGSEGGR